MKIKKIKKQPLWKFWFNKIPQLTETKIFPQCRYYGLTRTIHNSGFVFTLVLLKPWTKLLKGVKHKVNSSKAQILYGNQSI